MNYNKAFELAKNLQSDTPMFQDFNGNPFCRNSDFVCFSDTKPNVASLFAIVAKHSNNRLIVGKGYIYSTQTKVGEDGSILPKGQWRSVVLYHKKWSRNDVEVVNVSYDIVGVKRATTHLPAGVLITNIVFDVE